MKMDDKINLLINKYKKIIQAIIMLLIIIFLVESDKKQNTEIDTLKTSIAMLQAQAKQNEYKSTFGELESIHPRYRALVIAIAMTESNCNYNVKHPTNETIGIGGIKPACWSLQSNINSLKAIEEIVVLLQSKGKSPYEIIKSYKGAKTNLKSTTQCWDLYQRLENIL